MMTRAAPKIRDFALVPPNGGESVNVKANDLWCPVAPAAGYFRMGR